MEVVQNTKDIEKECERKLSALKSTSPEGWWESEFNFAVLSDDLILVKYLRKRGYVWDYTVTFSMVRDLNVFKYLHEQSCPYDENVVGNLIMGIFRIIFNQNHKHDDNNCNAKSAQECINRFLYKYGFWEPIIINKDERYQNLSNCLKYACEHKFPVSDQNFLHANEEVIKLFYHRQHKVVSTLALNKYKRHIRRHAMFGWCIIKTTVKFLLLYNRSCLRVYAPLGHGYNEASDSFHQCAKLKN